MQTLKEKTSSNSSKLSAELTNLKCQKSMPESKPYYLADRGGLYLLVAPTGGKLWRWRYRFEGKEKQMALGKYPDVSLAEARVCHAKARYFWPQASIPWLCVKKPKK